jgi:hypothetical protein
MFDQITVAYVTALFLIFMGYVAGYLVGRLDIIYSAVRLLCRAVHDGDEKLAAPAEVVGQPVARKARAARPADTTDFVVKPVVPVDINTSTFVTPISTAGMERAGAGELGKTTAVQDDIGASVSKLSQLKGK